MLSLRRRLVLLHLLAVLLAVGVTAATGWWMLSQSVNRQLDAALLALAEAEVAMLADSDGVTVRVHEAPVGSAPPALTRIDRLVQIVDGKGQILARSANLGTETLPVDATLLPRLAAGITVFDTLPDLREEPLRMVSVPTLAHGRRYAVQVAGSLDDVNSILQSAAILFAGMAVALTAAMAWAGARLTSKLFVAIENIVGRAHEIGDSNLHQRLPHPGGDDEISHLVDTLNAMLERIEHAFQAQQRFTADASHELRSPLSRLRAEIEITLRRQRDSGDYVTALRSCLEEVERLTHLVEELLMLARLDAGLERAPADLTPLRQLAEDLIGRMEPVARERGITLALRDELRRDTLADQRSLSLVLGNLLDNAIKFSPPDSRIEIQLEQAGMQMRVSVTDQGPGLDPAELPFVFDRFFRGAGSRAGEVDGFGLGLALSQTIMQAQGGGIEAANHPGGGARFSITFSAR
ncbi:HAMP domain-containing protein [Duganella sp. FT94W]|uniref:histidine kinase n=1 Tax=Duganella lactea TaxID=2692173 RepID=A0ABW9V749_9BURK|nr:ATP-binding protein [Duganella lactea]MYM34600.1 HAMP domain-containing protein [Duganella lactea]